MLMFLIQQLHVLAFASLKTISNLNSHHVVKKELEHGEKGAIQFLIIKTNG